MTDHRIAPARERQSHATKRSPVRAAGAVRYRLLRAMGAVVGVPYFRPRVRFAAPIPDGPFIVACNHTTMLDWAAIAYAIPRPVRFLVTRDYFDLPPFRWFCRMGGAIPVRRGRIEASSFRDALAALRAGEVVGIFPEGRITPDGRILPFQRGVSDLALLARCPVIPATIRGAFAAFPSHRRWPLPKRVEIMLGAAIAVSGFAPTLSDAERAEALTTEIRRRVTELAEPAAVAPVPTVERGNARRDVPPSYRARPAASDQN